MVLKRDVVERRLKELDEILQELNKYRKVERKMLNEVLSQRWIIERGLIAAASLILEIADHILASHFGMYVDTYEESLASLQQRGVISAELYRQLKGLGGFRNILVHSYLGIDTKQVFENFQKALVVFPQFGREILAWLDAQSPA